MDSLKQHGLTYIEAAPRLAFPCDIKNKSRFTNNVELLVFLHIPKCAGSTVNNILSAAAHYLSFNYARYAVTEFTPPVHIVPGWTGAWQEASWNISVLPGDSVHFISGHFPFGVHEMYCGSGCRYITLLRNPVEREVSSYNFHYQRGYGSDMSLVDMMRKGAVLDNPQTRMLAGIDSMTGICTEEDLEMAKSNLRESFSLVGLAEDTDGFISALLGLYGLPPILYHSSQITGVKRLENLTEDIVNCIENYHEFDMKLYQYAKAMWVRWKNNYIKRTGSLENVADKAIYLAKDFQQSGKALVLSKRQLLAMLSDVGMRLDKPPD